METALVRTESDALSVMAVARDPEVVLEEAHKAALALKRVVDGKPNKVMFNGEHYLEYEDWQCVGRFYGIAPKITSTTYVDYGGVKGWEASAEAVHVASGRVVSSADAMCLNDEEKWRARPKYAWAYVTHAGTLEVEDPGPQNIVWIPNPSKPGKKMPKKERVLLGEEAVPLFQLRSMAQTRAAAKALRNALAWVVVLAGYKPTPAEELPVTVVDAVPVTPAVPAETILDANDPTLVRQSEELFPGAPKDAPKAAAIQQGAITRENREERERLLARADALGDELGLSADGSKTIWYTFCGTATRKNVDVAALSDMVRELEARVKEKGAA